MTLNYFTAWQRYSTTRVACYSK